jgi:hypothetical protein
VSAVLGARGGCAAALLAVALAAAPSAPADLDEAPLYPLVGVTVLPDALLAIDAEGGGQLRERLELGEQVLFVRERGRVALVVTDRRVLAVAVRSGTWQQVRYRRGEAPPADVTLGDRVALVLLRERAIGFDGKTGNLVEAGLGPRERVLAGAVGANVVVVATDRRALGLSAHHGGFFEARVGSDERVEDVSAFANHVTLALPHRLLIFRGTTASWEERRLRLAR